MAGLTILQTRHKQVYKNFVDDPLVNTIEGSYGGDMKKLKDIFFEEIDKLVDDIYFVENGYSATVPYKKMGPENKLAGTEIGGTAMPLEDFLFHIKTEINKHLANNPHIGIASIDDKTLEECFRNAGLKKDFKALSLLIKDLELDGVSLKRKDRIMWCYINKKNNANIFDGIDKTELSNLPCILGLDPITFGKPYICFGHELKLQIYKPTAMDAGMFEYWRPGGQTQPSLPDCSTYIGKDEFVHNPNTIKSLTTQIEIF